MVVSSGSAHAGEQAARAASAGEDAYELAGQGHLLRLWKLPGESRSLGLWSAGDPAELQAILQSLPLDPWMTDETTPLTPHPSDPVLTGSPDTDLGSQAPADMS